MDGSGSKSYSTRAQGHARIAVIFVAAMFVMVAFTAFTSMNAKASLPTWEPPVWVTPDTINLGQTFKAGTNFSHADSPDDWGDLASGRIFISAPPGTGCNGTNDTAHVDPPDLSGLFYKVNVSNYRPDLPPFSLGPGLYNVYFSFADIGGNTTCSGAGYLSILNLDSIPPMVAGHGLTPPTGSDPSFNIDPATSTTSLRVGITDLMTGRNLITDGEYFYCGPSPTPCGPSPAWANDTGYKLTLTPFNPYEPPPPVPSAWDTFTSVYTTTTVNVSTWAQGLYWFYIHGADCGEDKVCQGGQGDDNWGKNMGMVGDYFYELNLTVGIPNDPPVLNWTGDPGYVSDGVDPDSGPDGAAFTYKVKYSDADNDTPPNWPDPGAMYAHIEKPCGSPIPGSPIPMTRERWVGAPNDWVAGAVFNMTTILSPGSNLYSYYFAGTDGVLPAVGDPTIHCTPGPIVTTTNTKPVLSWTGQGGFATDGINPDMGTTITTFEYRVSYTDADNDPPISGYPKVYIEKPCGTPWGSSPYLMTEMDPIDTDYTNGKLYNYSRKITDAGTDYAYYFNATDGKDWATGAPSAPCSAGPTVTQFINIPPLLSWSSEAGYTADGVNPDTGTSLTTFEFRVRYTDVNNDAPFSGTPKLYINKPCGLSWGSSPYIMSFASWVGAPNNYAVGAIYNFQTTLAPDGFDYAYYFFASDGTDYATGPPTIPCTDGPDVGSPAPAPQPPAGLWVQRSSPNIVLHWNASTGANSYYVYRSNDRFTAFQFWTLVPGVVGTQWTHSGAHSDSLTWFYIVKAYNSTGGLSANSTMGVKLHKALGTPYSDPSRNVYWMSLPYVSKFKKASDIVVDIEGSLFTTPTKINMVCKWNPAAQNAVSLSFSKGRWRGTDFAISAGDGICLNSINPAWSWVINGTDSNRSLSFSYNAPPKKNINWLSLPYTNAYQTASSIVLDIEGSLVTAPTKVKAIGWWNATSQSAVRYYWTGSAWSGTNFTIMPGEGYYFDILSSFNWMPDLLTAPVP